MVTTHRSRKTWECCTDVAALGRHAVEVELASEHIKQDKNILSKE